MPEWRDAPSRVPWTSCSMMRRSRACDRCEVDQRWHRAWPWRRRRLCSMDAWTALRCRAARSGDVCGGAGCARRGGADGTLPPCPRSDNGRSRRDDARGVGHPQVFDRSRRAQAPRTGRKTVAPTRVRPIAPTSVREIAPTSAREIAPTSVREIAPTSVSSRSAPAARRPPWAIRASGSPHRSASRGSCPLRGCAAAARADR